MAKTPAKNLDQYIVRFPDGMRDRLKEAAASNNRSLNAEIVSRLEDSFALEAGAPDGVEDIRSELKAFSNKLGRIRSRRNEIIEALQAFDAQWGSIEATLAMANMESMMAEQELQALREAQKSKLKKPE